MIEAFFRVAKQDGLFPNDLDIFDTVRRLVEFYINEYNARLAHSARKGRTPDKCLFGRAIELPDKLAGDRAKAKKGQDSRE